MGYRKRYNNLRIIRYDVGPNGKELKNKFAIVDGSTLVSSVRGLTKAEAKKQLPYYQKQRKFVFTG